MRQTPLKRRTPIKALNRERLDERFKKAFLSKERVEYIRWLGCAVPDCRKTPCENHHVTSRAAGGSYKDVIPLCEAHHSEIHAVGKITFAKRYGLDLVECARETDEAWESWGPEQEEVL